MNQIKINIPVLARVEGEGALELTIRDNQIEKLQLRIYEPPRLFEKFLEGRSYDEVLDIVARICGICPVAYQMSAVQALENIFQIKSSAWINQMRRLFYCGEWIESHSMHIHFLAAPDFFGFDSALAMAKKFPEEIRRGMTLQNIGNSLVKLLGARSVHPVGACVGGFYHAPTQSEITALLKRLQEAEKLAEQLLQWVITFPLPDNSQNFLSVSSYEESNYPMIASRIIADNGLIIPIDEFENYFAEYQVSYSNSLHCLLNNENYLVGPLARINLNYEKLPEKVKTMIEAAGIKFPSKNMFHSIIARAAEIYYAILEAIHTLENYQPNIAKLEVSPRAGIGYGCTEAPRGMLWHRYELDQRGLVKFANIVPPTTQNQARIEQDIKISLEKFGLQRPADELRAYSEMLIRNYDPCISCSTHFLNLNLQYL